MTPAIPASLVTARLPDGRSLIADIDLDRTKATSPLQRALAEAAARHNPRPTSSRRTT